MKKYPTKKSASSLLTFIIPLIIAVGVIIAAVVYGTYSTEIRSKASANGWQRCIDTCNNGFKGFATQYIVLDPAKCAADCTTTVVNNAMSCQQFCTTNFTHNTSQLNPENRNNSYQIQYCKNMCMTWVRQGNRNPQATGTPAPTASVNSTSTPKPGNGPVTTIDCKINFCQPDPTPDTNGNKQEPSCMRTVCTHTYTPGGSGSTNCISGTVKKSIGCKDY